MPDWVESSKKGGKMFYWAVGLFHTLGPGAMLQPSSLSGFGGKYSESEHAARAIYRSASQGSKTPKEV